MERVMLDVTIVLLVGMAMGMIFIPDALAVIEAMFFVEEIMADREEHKLSARYQTCRSIAKACGVQF